MESVLLSVRPKWCGLIANGEKTIEVRKTKPILKAPFKVYIYCTSAKSLNLQEYVKLHQATGGAVDDWSGKVIGEFICDDVFMMWDGYAGNQGDDCLTFDEREEYLQGNNGYGWHISDLKIYDEPKELSEFYKFGMLSYDDWLYGIYNGNGDARSSYESYKNAFKLSKAPQSWCYVEGTIYCKNCKHLMFSDCYAECGKAYKGIFSIDDFCDKGELR